MSLLIFIRIAFMLSSRQLHYMLYKTQNTYVKVKNENENKKSITNDVITTLAITQKD